MMLTLALRTRSRPRLRACDPAVHARRVAEAFAAARGLAIPTQVSEKLKEDPRPILDRFRELAPPRAPVSIQVWSLRRIAITAVALVGVIVLASMVLTSLAVGLD